MKHSCYASSFFGLKHFTWHSHLQRVLLLLLFGALHPLLSLTSSDLFLTSCLSRRVNVGCGPAEERVLLTGLHAVADIYCENCKTTLGWKYVSQLLLELSPELFYFSFPSLMVFSAAVVLRNYFEVFLASKRDKLCYYRSKEQGCSH